MPDKPLHGPAQWQVFLSVGCSPDFPLCRLYCAIPVPARERCGETLPLVAVARRISPDSTLGPRIFRTKHSCLESPNRSRRGESALTVRKTRWSGRTSAATGVVGSFNLQLWTRIGAMNRAHRTPARQRLGVRQSSAAVGRLAPLKSARGQAQPKT